MSDSLSGEMTRAATQGNNEMTMSMMWLMSSGTFLTVCTCVCERARA